MGYVAFTRFCRESGFVANTRFFLCLVQTFTQTLKILLRFCADICSKNWLLGPLLVIADPMRDVSLSSLTTLAVEPALGLVCLNQKWEKNEWQVLDKEDGYAHLRPSLLVSVLGIALIFY